MCLDYPICSLRLIPAEAYVSPRRSYCVYCVHFAGRPWSNVVILVQSVAVADTEPEIPSDSPRVTRETVQRARSTWPDQYMSGMVVIITDLCEFYSHNNKHSRCFSGNSKRRKLLVRRHNSAQRDQILVNGCPGVPDAQKSHRDAKFWHAWCPLDAHSWMIRHNWTPKKTVSLASGLIKHTYVAHRAALTIHCDSGPVSLLRAVWLFHSLHLGLHLSAFVSRNRLWVLANLYATLRYTIVFCMDVDVPTVWTSKL